MPLKKTPGAVSNNNADSFDPELAVEADPEPEPASAEPAAELPVGTLDAQHTPFDPDELPENFFTFIVAPRRSGKTEQMLHWLRHFHKRKRFTHYLLVSETLSGYEEYIPANYQFTNLDQVPEVIRRVQRVGKYNKDQHKQSEMVKCSVLLIMDDVIGSPAEVGLSKRGGTVQKIAVNGRHICREDPCKGNEFCTVLIAQRISLVPPVIRNNADVIMASRLASYMERRTLIENFLSLTSDREGLRLARGVFDNVTLSEEFRFIVIATHVANRMKYGDYVFYQDADVKKPSVKLFGTADDWKVKKPDLEF